MCTFVPVSEKERLGICPGWSGFDWLQYKTWPITTARTASSETASVAIKTPKQ